MCVVYQILIIQFMLNSKFELIILTEIQIGSWHGAITKVDNYTTKTISKILFYSQTEFLKPSVNIDNNMVVFSGYNKLVFFAGGMKNNRVSHG